MTVGVWFRRDLRLAENPAWAAAAATGATVVACFVVDPHLWSSSGAHRRDQLVAHLQALDTELQEQGGRLRVVHGDPVRALPPVEVDAWYWNDDYSPYATRRDAAIEESLTTAVHRFDGCVVQPPGTVLTKAGTPPKVFTPYYRRWQQLPMPTVADTAPTSLSSERGEGVPDAQRPPLMDGGERAAQSRLTVFLERVDDYPETRDRPDLDETSRLSADLKFGTIAPWDVARRVGTETEGRAAFVRQLCWRDFYANIIADNPHTVTRALRPEYDRIEWIDDDEAFDAWRNGQTGYPIVDAGMRQLLGEGWMHNRVRMITASFLVKDLLIDWRRGERHFRDLLVDGDLAQNVGNWQWVAGTGADAAPYFRIFNPVSQGRKFDPAGDYVRRWVPELAGVDAAIIHAPWEAAPLDLAAGGVTLGVDYPDPIIDHGFARERTLAAYEAARSGG